MENLLLGYLKDAIAPFGEVLTVEIVPAGGGKNALKIALMLLGESAPITIALGDLSLSFENGKTRLKIGAIKADREWLHKLAVKLAALNPALFAPEIPREYAAIITNYIEKNNLQSASAQKIK